MTPNFENPTPDDVVGLKPEDVTPVESSEMEETEESTKTEQQTEEVEDIFSDSLDQGSLKDLIEYLNKARQDNAEVEKVYRHVLGTATLTEGEHPDVLPVRPELATRFGIGNKGKCSTIGFNFKIGFLSLNCSSLISKCICCCCCLKFFVKQQNNKEHF